MNWFSKVAPIKTKFKAIVALQALIGVATLVVAYLAGTSSPRDAHMYVAAAAVLAVLPMIVAFVGGRIIAEATAAARSLADEAEALLVEIARFRLDHRSLPSDAGAVHQVR